MTIALEPGVLFNSRETAAQPARPTLFVVIDTEEEFDWSAPFSRDANTVTAMRHIDRTQALCDAVQLAPTYVIDYPVATTRQGFEGIAGWAHEGRCTIGAHLHPWVNPPYEEELNGRNSFTCNLPAELQRAKMRELCAAIRANTNITPRVFKAGRYGIGRDALATFDELGLTVDASVNPRMNFEADGGPDFSQFDSRPFWIDKQRGLLEVPCTHDFIGWARGQGVWLRRMAESLRGMRVPGILNRAGALNRVMLSPEGNTIDEMIALTRTLLADGVDVFSLTFHSPSVVPGHTPYVRTTSDLSTFLNCIERYFEFFFGELEGLPSTPESFRRNLLGGSTIHV